VLVIQSYSYYLVTFFSSTFCSLILVLLKKKPNIVLFINGSVGLSRLISLLYLLSFQKQILEMTKFVDFLA